MQVIYRHKIGPGTEAAFIAAWENTKSRMLGRVAGFIEASIFQNANDTSEFVCISRWTSVEDWKNYWGEGVPDPEGELPRNEILVEVKTLTRPTSKTARRSPRKSSAKKR